VATGEREHIKIYGTDYPTPDGTCVRDYVHVNDLAAAHLVALKYLLAGGNSTAYNLGNSKGYSVKQVIDAASRVTGRPISCVEAPRREGDPAVLIAASEKIRRELNWRPQFEKLEAIVASAWDWEQRLLVQDRKVAATGPV
jgi:UDP-glucose 4-epimerase